MFDFMFWNRRRQKNRRLGSAHVLDVKLRSDQVRASRMRLGTFVFGFSFAIIFGGYLLWRIGSWTLDRLVYENPSFAISEIKLETDGVISPDQLRRWAGPRLGQNLLALDLSAVKRNLELVSAVKSASVERVLPRTLWIRVSERKPVAQINVPRPVPTGGMEVVVYQIDSEGFVLQPLNPRQIVTPMNMSVAELPVLTGLGTADLQPGRRVESPQVLAALQLVSEFELSPMVGLVDFKRIDVGFPQILIVTTEQGSEVTFGLQNLDDQLLRWHQLHEIGRQMNRTIASLDLAVTNNTPVTWFSADAAPPARPQSTKSSRTKKKNV
jgi:cell division septal protein FtsQ